MCGEGRGRVAGTREGGRAQRRYKRGGEPGFDLLRHWGKNSFLLGNEMRAASACRQK